MYEGELFYGFVLLRIVPLLMMRTRIKLPTSTLIGYLPYCLYFTLSSYCIAFMCTFKGKKVKWDHIRHGAERG